MLRGSITRTRVINVCGSSEFFYIIYNAVWSGNFEKSYHSEIRINRIYIITAVVPKCCASGCGYGCGHPIWIFPGDVASDFKAICSGGSGPAKLALGVEENQNDRVER